MPLYDEEIKARIRALRSQGFTYPEIQETLGMDIPKGSLSYICKGITLGPEYELRIKEIVKTNVSIAREKAVAVNQMAFEAKVAGYRTANENLFEFMQDRRAKLVALSMLYLGEGAKWKGSRAPKLASSDPMILRLYINLLKECYDIKHEKLRCRVQHRADQNPEELLRYWSKVTGVETSNFYISYVDKRTIGNPTKKTGYRGVCTVSCAGTHIQLELAEIAGIIGGAVGGISAAG